MKKVYIAIVSVFMFAAVAANAQEDTQAQTRQRARQDSAAQTETKTDTVTPAAQTPAPQPQAAPAPTAQPMPETRPAPVAAQPAAEQKPALWQVSTAKENTAPSIETMAGFAIVPTNQWKTGQFVSYQDYLAVDFDQTALTTYEGSIWHNRTGLKLGVSADVDNNLVGKVNRFMGFLGYKKLFLRVQNGRLKGTASWTGPAVAGQPSSVAFDNKYSNIDLLYFTGSSNNGVGGFYWGLGYNSYSLPVQVNAELYSATRDEIVYGNAVYQDNLEYKTYTAMFGFDTMTGATMSAQKGFGFWAYSQDKIGFGKLEISDETARRLQAANSNKPIAMQTLTAATIDYDLTMGLMYTSNIKSMSLTLGAGYNIGGQVAFAFGGGDLIGNKDTQHVRANPFPYIMHYGPVFKAMVRW